MKKLISLLAAGILSLTMLTACSSNSTTDDGTGETIKLKVWGAQEDQTLLKELTKKFEEKNKDKKYDISFGVVSEADAKKELLKDPAKGADVFAFASDQIAELKSAGALYRITKNKDEIVKANSDASINACTVDSEMYAYPSSSDTYFMYYDKSKFSEEEVKSLDTILAKDLGAGVTNFSMDIDNGWYNASFFLSAGCKLFGDDGLDPKKCNFNDKNGVMAGELIIDLVNNKKFANHDDSLLKAAFSEGKLGATVTGTWNADDIKKALGKNYATAKLPTVKFKDGKEVQLTSLANFKLYGVNAHSKNPSDAMDLAEFLTNKESQQLRFEKRSFAPTNKELADSDALKSNEAVAALAEQAQYSVLQPSIPQMTKFWDPAEAFGDGVEDGSITKANLQTKLDTMVKSILSNITE